MKFLIIATIIAFVCAFIFLRLRPYILFIKRLLDTTRDLREVSNNNPFNTTRTQSTESNRLSRCSACGVWIPASRALTLRGSSALYCSPDCLERAASQPYTRNVAS
ncbi:MAG: hypothetical protein ABR577_02590 [Pyrinomonadaceae bacterium]